MWILENEAGALEGKRLWLRPGKRYLFGRTSAGPGQLAIKGPGADKVSRKHVTIKVDPVAEGGAEAMMSRPRVTVEDLGSKGGTKVNDHKYKGESCVLSHDFNTLQMGAFPAKFRITWVPVVLSFSFTKNQLRTNPLTALRQTLEQLDIKLLADYDVKLTTHVVSKKRNTSKGLQALINGRYIVNDGFIDAIIKAATPAQPGDGVAESSLERDFDANWPDPMKFLPPPGEEPVPRPPEAFAPNPTRAEIFDGYTFIFYNRLQFESLLGPITNGKGKALFREVVAGETHIDDFIRYVKEVAGEKGLGEFEDGSEGKGVVLVKWMPIGPEDADWFAEFFRSIALRLDHRPIDQKDFLEAILSNEASGLRRPLEFESPPPTSQPGSLPARPPAEAPARGQDMDVDEGEQPVEQLLKPVPRRRPREPVKSRFQGFAIALSDSDDDEASADAGPSAPAVQRTLDISEPAVESSQEGLFVSQDIDIDEPEESMRAARQSQRKRPASPLPDPEDFMDGFAPTAAQVKRRRIAAGEDPVPRKEAPPTSMVVDSERPKLQPKTKKEIDVLDLARQRREEAEKRAQQEREELEKEPGDIDLAEIRRLHVEKPMKIRDVPPIQRSREQDIADGRWNAAWNGRKNFKLFRQRGALQGRPPEKIIVALQPVKTKGFGIGDDYWLEDSNKQQQKQGHIRSQSSNHNHTPDQSTAGRSRESMKKQEQRRTQHITSVDSSDSEISDMDMDGDDDIVVPASRTSRTSRTPANNTTQSQLRSLRATTTQSTSSSRATSKRPASAMSPPAREQPTKKPRVVSLDDDSDEDSDDGLRFRFRKR
ncbi:hypothetical protein F5X96DRAFT_677569 [Biscogniauxia mediterranea]|nr:hypothetical protein F5X96DRAFT_677569 [Biscogniauxia mediterranea]